MERNFVGYGREPPKIAWPNGARIAVNFILNIEEGSEHSIPDGDQVSEGRGTETGASLLPSGVRDMAAESMFEYGSRVGYWRLRKIFLERGIPFTAFACALALERNPLVTESILKDGVDVCCHGRRWIYHATMSEDQERREIDEAVAVMTRLLGKPPSGWYCRYAPSPNTRRLLVEKSSFLYDSDAYNDELPYWVSLGGKSHLVIPYSLTTNDGKFASGIATGAQFFELLRETFDVLYAEGLEQPKMMSVGLHLRIAGHPARAAGLARFIDYVCGHQRVWITGREELARFWIENYPQRAGAVR